MGIFLDLRCIYFSLKFFLLAPLFMAFFFFASGNFSRNDCTTTAAVSELVWEMNELA